MRRKIIIPIATLSLLAVGLGLGFGLTHTKTQQAENETTNVEKTVLNNGPYTFEEITTGGVSRVSKTESEFKPVSGDYVEYFSKGTPTYSTDLSYHMEAAAKEFTSDYFYFNSEEGNTYNWTINHRGRNNNDMLAIITGPKQDIEATKADGLNRDQYSKLAKWVKRNVYSNNISVERMATIDVYTTKFLAGGKFENEADTYAETDNGPYSLTPDDTHTEKWNVTLICSSLYWWKEYNNSFTASSSGEMVLALAQPDFNANSNLIKSFTLSTNSNNLFNFNVDTWLASHTAVKNSVDSIGYYNAEVATDPYSKDTFCTTNSNFLEFGKYRLKSDGTKYDNNSNKYNLVEASQAITKNPTSGNSYLISRGVYKDLVFNNNYDSFNLSFDIYGLFQYKDSSNNALADQNRYVNVMAMDTDMNISLGSNGYTQIDLLEQYLTTGGNQRQTSRVIYSAPFNDNGTFVGATTSNAFSLTKDSIHTKAIYCYTAYYDVDWKNVSIDLLPKELTDKSNVRLVFGGFGYRRNDYYGLDNVTITESLTNTLFDGSGTKYDPYLIQTKEDFIKFRNLNLAGETFVDVYFKQTCDITFDENLSCFIESNPVFAGTYNGDGYNLINVTIDGTYVKASCGRSRACIFGSVTGSIINLGVKNILCKGWSCSGLADSVKGNAVVENVFVTGTIQPTSNESKSYGAGLVSALTDYATLRNSFFNGTLTTTQANEKEISSFGAIGIRNDNCIVSNVYSSTTPVIGSLGTVKDRPEFHQAATTAEEFADGTILTKLNEANDTDNILINSWELVDGNVVLVKNNQKVNIDNVIVSMPGSTTGVVEYWKNTDYENEDPYYYLFLPRDIDRDEMIFTVLAFNSFTKVDVYALDGTFITTLVNGECNPVFKTLDEFIIKMYQDTEVVDQKQIKIMESTLDSVFITLDGGDATLQSINNDAKHNTGGTGSAIINYDNGSTVVSSEYNISKMKGRGNWTWGRAKRPYQVAFSTSFEMLGMPTNKKWLFIANYLDPTLSRSTTFYQLAKDLGIEYSVDFKVCDLYINGEYKGNYLVTSKVEPGENRVNITDDDYLFEFDNQDDTVQFTSTKGSKITIKDPNVEDLGQDIINETIAKGSAYFNSIDELIYDQTKTYEDLKEYLDLESFAKYYWVSEISQNYDAMYGSTYCYTKDGKLHMGPLWDVDNSLCLIPSSYPKLNDYFMMVDTATGSYANNGGINNRSKWYIELMKREEFSELVDSIYIEYKDVFDSLVSDLETYYEKIDASAAMNFVRYKFDGKVYSTGYTGAMTLSDQTVAQARTSFKNNLAARVSFYDNIYNSLVLDSINYSYTAADGSTKQGSITPNTKFGKVNEINLPVSTKNGIVTLTGKIGANTVDLGTVTLVNGVFEGNVYSKSETGLENKKSYDNYAYSLLITEECSLTINANGGTVSATTISGYYGDVVSIPVPTKDGYVFEGYSLSNGEYLTVSELSSYTVKCSTTLTANWSETDEQKLYNYNVEAYINTYTFTNSTTNKHDVAFITTVKNAQNIKASDMTSAKIKLTCNGVSIERSFTKIYNTIVGIEEVDETDRYLNFNLYGIDHLVGSMIDVEVTITYVDGTSTTVANSFVL